MERKIIVSRKKKAPNFTNQFLIFPHLSNPRVSLGKTLLRKLIKYITAWNFAGEEFSPNRTSFWKTKRSLPGLGTKKTFSNSEKKEEKSFRRFVFDLFTIYEVFQTRFLVNVISFIISCFQNGLFFFSVLFYSERRVRKREKERGPGVFFKNGGIGDFYLRFVLLLPGLVWSLLLPFPSVEILFRVYVSQSPEGKRSVFNQGSSQEWAFLGKMNLHNKRLMQSEVRRKNRNRNRQKKNF